MTKDAGIKKLNKNGYKVTFTMSGNVIAEKGQKRYTAPTITSLVKKVFT